MRTGIFLTLLGVILCSGIQAQQATNPGGDKLSNANMLSAKAIADGWIQLFDGSTDYGWKPRGEAKWTVVDGTLRSEAGQLSAFWAGLPHQVTDYGDEPEYFVATLPLAWFLQCKLPDGFVHALLHGQIISESEPHRAQSDGRLFAGWEADLRKPNSGLVKAVLLEMEARLLRLALKASQTDDALKKMRTRRVVIEEGGFNKVEKMACLIAQRYTEHLTIDAIGRVVDLHPNYAMSLFRKAFGTTLNDYLTQHRVSHAQRLLATTDQKIVDVAMDSGFGSISRFSDAFRRACGCSPREYRRQHRMTM